MFAERLKKTTAKFYRNLVFQGSGVIYSFEKQLFVITAGHVIWGDKFDQLPDVNEWSVEDYNGIHHKIPSFACNMENVKGNDILQLQLTPNASLENFEIPIFGDLPAKKEFTMFFRGSYRTQKEIVTVNKLGITFDELKAGNHLKFIADIDKIHLQNHDFDFGSEWLKGCSGAGIFLENRNDLICVGILTTIPNKGDDGKLQCTGILALEGFGPRIIQSAIQVNNPDKITDQWISERLDLSVKALGKRYTPELNFPVNLSTAFSGISRSTAFKKGLDAKMAEIFEALRRCYYYRGVDFLSDEVAEVSHKLAEFKKLYRNTNFEGITNIDYNVWSSHLGDVRKLITATVGKLYKSQEEKERKDPTPRHSYKPHSTEIYESRQLTNSIDAFINYIENDICKISNNPYIILKGEAGFGKSHLLGDLVRGREKNGEQSIMVLGHHFTTQDNPLAQLCALLDWEGSFESFVGSLNAKAQLKGKRSLFVIDAINEGQGKGIWKDHLPALLKIFKRYRWLSLIVSIRSSYFDLLVDDSLRNDDAVSVLEHYGFAENEYEATAYFFDNYGINRPEIPLLHPEFRSPLFLKTFCEGLQNRNLHSIPPGMEGITMVMDLFLDSVNEKLAATLNYPVRTRYLQKAVSTFVIAVTAKGASYLEFDELLQTLEYDPRFKSLGDKPAFIEALIHESVLAANIYRTHSGEHLEGLYMLYERFNDHLQARILLESVSNPYKAFSSKGPLFRFVKDEIACYENSGLIEAFFVQIPERFGLELFDLLPHVKDTFIICRAFIQSIIWRKKESFVDSDKGILGNIANWWNKTFHGYPTEKKSVRLLDYINRFNDEDELESGFLRTILFITAVPGHFFNADFLHRWLYDMSLAERDTTMLPWFVSNYNNHSPVGRLVNWGYSEEKRKHLNAESISLICTTIGWFLISSNRKLRDSATKAIISLLSGKEEQIIKILKKFESVNDPYVTERLYAAAYGATLRAENFEYLSDLTEYIKTAIFPQEGAFPHILVRDYAFGILSFASKKGIKMSFGLEQVSPPYSSVFPEDIPTTEEILRLYDKTQEEGGSYYQQKIISSMEVGSYGDFGNYVFDSAIGHFDVKSHEMKCLAVDMIFKNGYDGPIYEDAEDMVSGQDDEKERIGKKYQWATLHKLLAMVSDNFSMKSDRYSDDAKGEVFAGAWQIGARDIEISTLITETMDTGNEYEPASSSWWSKAWQPDWGFDNESWMLSEADIPEYSHLLDVTNSKGESWICLETLISSSEEVEPGDDSYESPQKRLYVQIRPYIIEQSDFNAFSGFGKTPARHKLDLPESDDKSKSFSREFYWSNPYHFEQQDYEGGNGDCEIYAKRRFLCDAHIPVQLFRWEKSRDFSKKNTIEFYRLTSKIFDALKLKFGEQEGELLNGNNELVCFDPSVYQAGPSCLLIRKKEIQEYLHASNSVLCWVVYGQKQVLGNGHSTIPPVEHSINGFYYLDGTEVKGSTTSLINRY